LNNFFKFKQFTIYQDNCAMKVCTDACLFGAWVAKCFEEKKVGANKIMDIGCGTGLLSLMLAQKTTATVDAIEIDAEAYLQATENITSSIFKNQINTFHGPIELFAAHTKYDFIICNPPFYENQLKSDKDDRNAAMHDDTLNLESLITAIENNLADNGNVAILLPYERMIEMEQLFTKSDFFINFKLEVKHSPKHPFFRTMVIASRLENANIFSEISIKNTEGDYSTAFIDLLKDFYLNF
jgi:tRNA1Val (adenine37-N6)-methyltransferase